MRSLKTLLTVIGAVTVLVLASNTLALAATGHALILGKKNTANKITKLNRTTAGPALKIKTTSSSAAPLKVNGAGKVTNLNADSVDGKSASAFEPKVGALVWHNLPLAGSWTTCFTGTPQYAIRFGIVYFRGSLCGGTTNSAVFTVPAEARPVRTGSNVYLVVNQITAATGRIYINTGTGVATSQSDPASPGADTFISLEGVSYPIS